MINDAIQALQTRIYKAHSKLTSKPGSFTLYMLKEEIMGIHLEKEKVHTLMMLGGEHLGDRYIWWIVVSSRKERIEKAGEDWKQGRILLPPTDHDEFVPLPWQHSGPAGVPPIAAQS